jgi:signal transduction histidine kinase
MGHRAGLEVFTRLPDTDGAERLPPEVETTVYRVAQEALTNVAKHAAAKTARLTLALDPGSVTVEVSDDGAGFDPDEATAGFGVMGMRERVELAGGRLEIGRRDGWTVVRAEVPVR